METVGAAGEGGGGSVVDDFDAVVEFCEQSGKGETGGAGANDDDVVVGLRHCIFFFWELMLYKIRRRGKRKKVHVRTL